MKYKCIEEMYIEKCDGDGFTIENKYGWVPVGSVWYEDDINITGGEVHLENASGSEGFKWIEITKEDLKEYFVKVSE